MTCDITSFLSVFLLYQEDRSRCLLVLHMRVNVLEYFSSEHFELRTKWRRLAFVFNLQLTSVILTVFLQNSCVLYSWVSWPIFFFQIIMGSYYYGAPYKSCLIWPNKSQTIIIGIYSVISLPFSLLNRKWQIFDVTWFHYEEKQHISFFYRQIRFFPPSWIQIPEIRWGLR